MTPVEFGHNDLTAGHVDERASRYAHENNVDQLITLRNLHANDDAQGSNQREYAEKQDDLLSGVAGACECSSERNSCSAFMDEDACGELACLLDLSDEAEGDTLEKRVSTEGEHEDDGCGLAHRCNWLLV